MRLLCGASKGRHTPHSASIWRRRRSWPHRRCCKCENARSLAASGVLWVPRISSGPNTIRLVPGDESSVEPAFVSSLLSPASALRRRSSTASRLRSPPSCGCHVQASGELTLTRHLKPCQQLRSNCCLHLRLGPDYFSCRAADLLPVFAGSPSCDKSPASPGCRPAAQLDSRPSTLYTDSPSVRRMIPAWSAELCVSMRADVSLPSSAVPEHAASRLHVPCFR